MTDSAALCGLRLAFGDVFLVIGIPLDDALIARLSLATLNAFGEAPARIAERILYRAARKVSAAPLVLSAQRIWR